MTAALPLTPVAGGVRVYLRVTPRGGRDAIDGLAPSADGPRLKLRVRAVPEDGKANDAVMALLAKAWGLPVSRLRLIAGASARTKSVEVAGDPAEVTAALTSWFQSHFAKDQHDG